MTRKLYGVCMLPSFDFTVLPTLLCGPILRRVTRRRVAVFVAMTGDASAVTASVTLEVRQGNDWAGARSVGRTDAMPLRIGARLSVACIELEVDEGFMPGVEYLYRVSGAALNAVDWDAFALSGRNAPGFIGLPAGEDGLRLAHTSCRKPHGGGRDAMGLLSGLMQDPAQRPHLMVLSGDQIYADDITQVLFPSLRALARGLVGRDEGGDFPAEFETGPDVAPLRPLEQSVAREVISHQAGLTVTHPENQLWLFEDYVAHYLIAWSAPIWTTPAFDNAVIAELPITDVHYYRANPSMPLSEGTIAAFERRRAPMFAMARVMPEIARAMANVPILMTYDDHEVTDDWNLHFNWVKTVYAASNTVGRRIVANGLAAYLLFQHWGNRPEDMAPGAPGALAIAPFLFGAPSESAAERADNEARLGLPDPATFLDETIVGRLDREGEPVFTTGHIATMAEMRGAGRPLAVDWSVRLFTETVDTVTDATGAQQDVANPPPIALLDARMRRGFGGRIGETWRVAPPDLPLMLPDPVPDDPRPLIVVEPIPVFGLHLIEHILQPAKVFLKGPEAADKESWTGDSLEALVERLALWRRAVLLGGDVHYGFTKRVEISPGSALATPSSLVQFCGSAAKNAEDLTLLLHQRAALTQALDLTRRRRFLVWDRDPSQIDPAIFASPPNADLPFDSMIDIALGRTLREGASRLIVLDAEVAAAYGIDEVTTPPRYSYVVELVDDEHRDPDRLSAHEAARGDLPAPSWSGWSADNSATIVADLMFYDVERMGRVASGMPQIGVVSFSAPSGGDPTVAQVLHRAGGDPSHFADPTAEPALARAWMAGEDGRTRTEVTIAAATS